MLVANINKCILKIDFLKKIHLEDIFKPISLNKKRLNVVVYKIFSTFCQILNIFLRKVQEI